MTTEAFSGKVLPDDVAGSHGGNLFINEYWKYPENRRASTQ